MHDKLLQALCGAAHFWEKSQAKQHLFEKQYV